MGFWCGQRPGSGAMTVMRSSTGWKVKSDELTALCAEPMSWLCFQLMEQTKPEPATPPHLDSILSLLSWKEEAIKRAPSDHCSEPHTHSLVAQR